MSDDTFTTIIVVACAVLAVLVFLLDRWYRRQPPPEPKPVVVRAVVDTDGVAWLDPDDLARYRAAGGETAVGASMTLQQLRPLGGDANVWRMAYDHDGSTYRWIDVKETAHDDD